MTVVGILSEASKCSSEIFDEIFLFLYFILDNNCSQMYVLPKTDDMNKCDRGVRVVFLWKDRAYESPVERLDQISELNV